MWQPLYEQMAVDMPNISFVEGIQVPEINTGLPYVVIIDDQMMDATHSKTVCDMFTVGSHHQNMSVICIFHNLFQQGPVSRSISLNAQYLVLFKSPRDVSQINYLARQMYPQNTSVLMDKYKKATSPPHGCLIVDLKQDTPESQRIRSGNFMIGQPPQLASDIRSTELQCASEFVNTAKSPEPCQPEPESTNISTLEMYCSDCGTMFKNQHYLTDHKMRGCEMEMDDDESGDEDIWCTLLDAAYTKYDHLYGNKVDDLQEQGMTEKEASWQATQQLLPKYRKSLVNNYKKLVKQMSSLHKSNWHREIMQSVRHLMEYKDMEIEEALDIAMRKKRSLINQIMEELDASDNESDATDEVEQHSNADDESDDGTDEASDVM